LEKEVAKGIPWASLVKKYGMAVAKGAISAAGYHAIKG
jgi:hypothetical protein